MQHGKSTQQLLPEMIQNHDRYFERPPTAVILPTSRGSQPLLEKNGNRLCLVKDVGAMVQQYYLFLPSLRWGLQRALGDHSDLVHRCPSHRI